MVVIGNMAVGWTIAKVEEFVNVLQVCVDAGAKKVFDSSGVCNGLADSSTGFIGESAASVLCGSD